MNLKLKHSLAAKKGWITRRKNIRAKLLEKRKRSLAAKRGYAKRKKQLKQKLTKSEKQLRQKREQEILSEIKILKERNRELEKQLVEIKTEKPEKPFVKVIEPEKPKEKKVEDFLINDPEFAFYRGQMVGAMKYLKEKMQRFADGYPFTYEGRTLNPSTTHVDIDTAPLADGSVIVQAKFESIWNDDDDDFRMFTLLLESYLLSLGPLYRISIAQQWDPSKLDAPYEIKDDIISINLEKKHTSDFIYFKGLAEAIQNVSTRIPDSFDTMRDFEGLSGLREKLGYPDYLTVRLVWGESVMRMARKATMI